MDARGKEMARLPIVGAEWENILTAVRWRCEVRCDASYPARPTKIKKNINSDSVDA